MIEAPSLIWHLDALLPLTDFVSVGTNDLMQYLFAADRGNPRPGPVPLPHPDPARRGHAGSQPVCHAGGPAKGCEDAVNSLRRSGAHEVRTRNIEVWGTFLRNNLEIPGSTLSRRPGMTGEDGAGRSECCA